VTGFATIGRALAQLRASLRQALRAQLRSDAQRRFARGALWTLAGVATSRAVMLLVSVVTARLLGGEGFGQLGMVRASVAMMTALAGFGLVNLVPGVRAAERYSYNYEGNSQMLDHILVSPALARLEPTIEIPHLNADFPASARASDHDPVVVELDFSPVE